MIKKFYEHINTSQLKKLTFNKNETLTPYHHHYPTEIIYCLNGALTIDYFDNKNQLKKIILNHNMACVIQSLVQHTQYAMIDNTSILLIEFSNKFAYESDVFSFLSSTSLFPFDNTTVQILKSLPKVAVFNDINLKLYDNMKNLFNLLQSVELNNIFYVKYYAQVLDLFCNIATAQQQAQTDIQTNKHVKLATTYIKENYSNPKLSVSKIAKLVQVSEVYLQKLFKDHYGKTIKQYITEKRLCEAKKLMKDKTPFSQIAKNVGYKDYVTFYHIYVKFEKISPSEYRNKINQENIVIRKT